MVMERCCIWPMVRYPFCDTLVTEDKDCKNIPAISQTITHLSQPHEQGPINLHGEVSNRARDHVGLQRAGIVVFV